MWLQIRPSRGIRGRREDWPWQPMTGSSRRVEEGESIDVIARSSRPNAFRPEHAGMCESRLTRSCVTGLDLHPQIDCSQEPSL